MSVKTAVQLWSQIWPTDSKDPDARLLKPCDTVADGGKSGKGIFVVDLEVIMFPFGTMTLTDGLSMEVGRWCK